jgi:transposase
VIPATTLRELYWTRQMSTVEIGQLYNAHKATVERWMKLHNIPSRTKRDAALLLPSEWTPERVKLLKQLWYTDLTCSEIRDKIGIKYGPRSISAKAKALGLEPRQEPRQRPIPAVRNVVRPEPAAPPKRVSLDYSLIQLPPHLQAVFEACVAEVRSERGSAA